MPREPKAIPSVPTPALIAAYDRQFHDTTKYTKTEAAVQAVFERYPRNAVILDTLIKVCVLNSLYGTNIAAVYEVAEHIRSLHIDDDLARHSPDVVRRIAEVKLGGDKGRTFYSFATKYCHFHAPEAYSLYDSFLTRRVRAGHRT